VLALTVAREATGCAVELRQLPEPSTDDGDILVETLAVGVCGTDREIAAGRLVCPPEGRDWLVMGHESLGRVLEAPSGSGLVPGDLVTGVVRRPDPVPCQFCAMDQPDMCENGQYTERGIIRRDGFAAERFRIDHGDAVRVDRALGQAGVLVEPASVVTKAWEQLDQAARRPRRRALVLGAGPIGLLAAMLGVQRGLEVHVVDRAGCGPKPRQARALGAVYHTSPGDLEGSYDAVLECCGELISEAIARTAPAGAVCLVSGDRGPGGAISLAELSYDLVHTNKMIIGTVNSNRHHFQAAQEALLRADRGWLEGLLTEHVPLREWRSAFTTNPENVKTVIHFGT
jgi:threonine dehydrogenase-like Zn-dependent dehydrogenase